jgi:hypothetical protein
MVKFASSHRVKRGVRSIAGLSHPHVLIGASALDDKRFAHSNRTTYIRRLPNAEPPQAGCDCDGSPEGEHHMPKVQVTSQIEIDFDEVLKGIALLKNSELEQFTDKVIALRAQRRAPNLPKDEAELLQKINAGVPSEMHRRFAELDAKMHDETITPMEQQELLKLTDQMELADAERMHNLTLLAEMRNVSVDLLMAQLGINRSAHA